MAGHFAHEMNHSIAVADVFIQLFQRAAMSLAEVLLHLHLTIRRREMVTQLGAKTGEGSRRFLELPRNGGDEDAVPFPGFLGGVHGRSISQARRPCNGGKVFSV
jgi:hypothetical protein